jgi:Uma2 family endonuclease
MTLQSLPISDEDLHHARDTGGVEFVNGQLVEKPVSKEASRVAAEIIFLLKSHLRGSGGAEVFDCSLGYQCFPEEPSRFRKPDVSVIRQERLAKLDPDLGLMPIHADLAVEVLSPTDFAYDVAAKIDEYLRNGFPLVWVVEPNTRTVVVHRADGSVTKLRDNDEITGESALPDFRCKVAEFFAQPAAKAK